MPELPEVETTRKGIEPYCLGQVIRDAVVRKRQLRLPITRGIQDKLKGQCIQKVSRRGKYLLLHLERGALLIHLGMSGSLRITTPAVAPAKHDHFDLVLANRKVLRYHDPRRFGLVLYTLGDPLEHRLLCHLGCEPLTADFSADHLYRASRSRKLAVKNFIMDSKVVVGVGNIYASEALFAAGIHPARPAGDISKARYATLVKVIRKILRQAIRCGGTTLRDFVNEDGKPGYFAQRLAVYHRQSQACTKCGTLICKQVIGQRASFYCPRCQS